MGLQTNLKALGRSVLAMSLICLTLSGAQAAAPEKPGRESLLPEPGGPHAIGTMLFPLADATRANTDSEDRPREIKVQLFYPAAAARAKSPYLSEEGLGAAMIREKYWAVDPQVIESWTQNSSHSFAEPPAQGKAYPLILFSPGLGVGRTHYTGYAEALASHGFIVAVIDHPNLGFALSAKGKLLTPSAASFDKAPLYAKVIAEDGRFVIDRLLADTVIGPLIDAGRIGMAGHSLGGAGSLVACGSDPRLKACADLDGFPFGATPDQGFKRPTLVMFAKPGPADRALDAQRIQMRDLFLGMLKNGDTGSKLVFVSGATHLSFSDFPLFLPFERMEKQGQTVPALRLHEMISRTLTAFFSREFGVKGGADVGEIVASYPEMSLQP